MATSLPCFSAISKASKDAPYTAVVLRFSLDRLYRVLKGAGLSLKADKSSLGIAYASPSDELLASLKRALELAKTGGYPAKLALDELIF